MENLPADQFLISLSASKNRMPERKDYEPRCPAVNCAGGTSDRIMPLNRSDPRPARIPQKVLNGLDERTQLWWCSYCGLVWTQKSTSRPGFDPTPIGFYD